MRDALAAWVGEIDQVPSAVSAVKVDGKRAYARVRAGEDVDLPVASGHHPRARRDRPSSCPTCACRVHCSSGTYIRAIARDLGEALGVGGHLTALRRTAVGPFDLTAAHTLDELAEHFATTPIGEAARATFPAWSSTPPRRRTSASAAASSSR